MIFLVPKGANLVDSVEILLMMMIFKIEEEINKEVEISRLFGPFLLHIADL